MGKYRVLKKCYFAPKGQKHVLRNQGDIYEGDLLPQDAPGYLEPFDDEAKKIQREALQKKADDRKKNKEDKIIRVAKKAAMNALPKSVRAKIERGDLGDVQESDPVENSGETSEAQDDVVVFDVDTASYEELREDAQKRGLVLTNENKTKANIIAFIKDDITAKELGASGAGGDENDPAQPVEA